MTLHEWKPSAPEKQTGVDKCTRCGLTRIATRVVDGKQWEGMWLVRIAGLEGLAPLPFDDGKNAEPPCPGSMTAPHLQRRSTAANTSREG